MLHLRQDDDIDYPCSDGEPLGETDLHRKITVDIITTLESYFAHHDQVYVSGDILLYYQKGSRKHVSPDVLVTVGLPKGLRDTYLLWKEGKVPDFVIEITSKTRKNDDIRKKGMYAQLGIKEYLMFDPTSDYLKPRFQAFVLGKKRYAPVLLRADQGYDSPSLGLTFRVVEDQLRIFETATQRLVLTPVEQARAAEQQAIASEKLARAAEQQAMAAEQQAMAAEQKAKAATKEAQAAIQRAESEAAVARRYRDRLRELGIDPESV